MDLRAILWLFLPDSLDSLFFCCCVFSCFVGLVVCLFFFREKAAGAEQQRCCLLSFGCSVCCCPHGVWGALESPAVPSPRAAAAAAWAGFALGCSRDPRGSRMPRAAPAVMEMLPTCAHSSVFVAGFCYPPRAKSKLLCLLC